jgi:ATP-dependent DNA helicase RecQ
LVEFTNEFVKRINYRLKQTPIIANRKGFGKIKLVRYINNYLTVPLVNDILTTALKGTTCILTKTNEEASQITGLLLKNGMQAKLIQTNDGFSLYNLNEVRFFLDELKLLDDVFTISDEIWDNAKRALKVRFNQSSKIEICNNIIKDFEVTNPKSKYKSDLEVFIRESKLEDFFNENGETIFVSTIHKAKGKEFDNVFLMLENINYESDGAKRQLYVALTRAKENLYIHLNNSFLDNIKAENLERLEDKKIYLPSNEMAVHLSYKDVWLDYFVNKQHFISNLISGDTLSIDGDQCSDLNGQSVLKFSKQFLNYIENMKLKGFQVKKVTVNFIVYWLKENETNEIKIVLPELYFVRID